MKNVFAFGVLLALAAGSVSALNCWEDHPTSAIDYSAPLCRYYAIQGYSIFGSFSGYTNGMITATQPSNPSNVIRVILTSYGTGPYYPVTLKCYKRMPGAGSTYWWLYKATCTMNSGGTTTGNCPSWDAAGCVPTANIGPSSPPTSPQGPMIFIGWGGVGNRVGKVASAAMPTKARSRR